MGVGGEGAQVVGGHHHLSILTLSRGYSTASQRNQYNDWMRNQMVMRSRNTMMVGADQLHHLHLVAGDKVHLRSMTKLNVNEFLSKRGEGSEGRKMSRNEGEMTGRDGGKMTGRDGGKMTKTENSLESFAARHRRILTDLEKIKDDKISKVITTQPTPTPARVLLPQPRRDGHVGHDGHDRHDGHNGHPAPHLGQDDNPNLRTMLLQNRNSDKEKAGEGLVPMETSVIMEGMLEEGIASCTIS